MTTLLSPARADRQPVYGERDSDVFFVDASLDGSIAYLESEEQLTRVASRPRALRLARGKTWLTRRGRGIALRLTATRRLLVGAERIVAGRRDGATCRPPTRRLRSAPRCTRTLTAARPLRLKTSSSRAVLRLGRRSLKPGRYRITLTPLDADGRAGAPARLTLKLKR